MKGTRRSGRRRGTVAVWVVVSLAVLLGIVAIGMDGGRMMDERQRAQAAADAAALAAAADLYENYRLNAGTDPAGTARAAALRVAAANGYTNDGTASVVAVNIPPLSGPFAGRAEHAEVLIDSNLTAGFSRVLSRGTLPVRARAVARGRPEEVGLVVLDPDDDGALRQSGNGQVEVAGPVAVNSASGAAMQQSGNGVLKADYFDVVGGYQRGGLVVGTVHTGAEPTADPLRTFPPPDPAAYPVVSTVTYDISAPGEYTLVPGVYRGGISVSGQATITMSPGVYVLDGGGFQVSGQATITGDGVLLYNTGGSRAGKIQISGNGVLQLTAPTTGPYQGVSIFQDRGVSLELQFSGNGVTSYGGVVYAPAAQVSLSGNGAVGMTPLGGGFVCNTLTVSGNGTFLVDAGTNRPKVPEVRLVD